MKLKTKFALLTCLLAVIIVIGVSLIMYIEERRMLFEEMGKNQKETVSSIRRIAEESIITSNEILLLNYLRSMKLNPEVSFAMFTSPEGQILSHSDATKLGDQIEDKFKISESSLKEENFFHTLADGSQTTIYTAPVEVRGNIKGIAWAAFDRSILQKKIDSTLRSTRYRVAYVGGAGLLIGILGAVILSSMMTGPIKKMAEGASKIGNGKLSTRIDVNRKDELGMLAEDLNRMARKLAELDEMKQDFVSSITHEFRSPLNAMSIHFELLLREKLGSVNPKQKKSLKILKNNAKRLEKFINDLLDIAKIEKGKMDIVPETFKPAEQLEEICSLYSAQAEDKNISFSTDIPDNLPKVYADPDRTKQVLANLINNAIKFTPGGGQVTVNGRKSKNFVEVRVKDTGMGMSKEQQKNIFDKFEQIKGIRKKIKGQKGTGLGLTITKGIVESQGGRIDVESQPERGSTFIFTLPLANNGN